MISKIQVMVIHLKYRFNMSFEIILLISSKHGCYTFLKHFFVRINVINNTFSYE